MNAARQATRAELEEAVADARRFAAAVESQNAAALGHHSADDDGLWCFTCRAVWPCPTALALGVEPDV